MAARTKKTETAKVETPEVVATTFDKEPTSQASSTSETITIACCLPHGLEFDDVDTAHGGTKTIRFPGLNDSLRGQRSGILIGAGNSVAVTIDKKDWECIVRKHGREAAFTGVNGRLPCLLPMQNEKEFKSRSDEIKDMSHGLDPIDPKTSGVKEVSQDQAQ